MGVYVMKALAILNLIKNNDIKISGILKEDINKAIEELESLQNRSCKNCKFNIDFKNLNFLSNFNFV